MQSQQYNVAKAASGGEVAGRCSFRYIRDEREREREREKRHVLRRSKKEDRAMIKRAMSACQGMPATTRPLPVSLSSFFRETLMDLQYVNRMTIAQC